LFKTIWHLASSILKITLRVVILNTSATRTMSIRAVFCLWTLFLAFSYAKNSENEMEVLVERKAVAISYNDLKEAFEEGHGRQGACSTKLLEDVEEAFGPAGLGFLEVTDIPQEMVALRRKVLTMAQELANLPTPELEEITLPNTLYTIGWSHGKEQFRGEYDTGKGSFYFNPFQEEVNVFPGSMQPHLEASLMETTKLMSQIGMWVASLCDMYLKQQNLAPQKGIPDSLAGCQNAKARLLYYFPRAESNDSLDSWCGWHKDHGSLTILVPGLLFGNDGEDTKAGLYIRTRDRNQVVHVKLPPTSMGVQLGETLEIQSFGRFRATPHAVKSSSRRFVGRASLALFLQPLPEEPLPELYPHVDDKSLQMRWRPTFGSFQTTTTQAFN
jgi:isopenicillin N synthase-like dioxygenase